MALPQQHHVFLLVVPKLWSKNKQSLCVFLQNNLLHQRETFCTSHLKRFDRSNSNKQLRLGFCDKLCVQLTLLVPSSIRKCLIERPLLMAFVLTNNNCFIQWKARFEKFCPGNLNQLLASPRTSGNLSNSGGYQCLWGKIFFGSGRRHFSTVSFFLENITHTFFLPLDSDSFTEKSSCKCLVFIRSGICCISNGISASFFWQVFRVVRTTW